MFISKIRKILEEDDTGEVLGFVFLGVFTLFSLLFFGLFFIPWMIEDFLFFKLFVILFWFGFLFWFWYLVIKRKRLENIILKCINNGTIIVKTPRITKFKYFEDSDSDGAYSGSGYIVFADDGGDVYESGKIYNSIFTGGSGFSVDKDYFIKLGIPYSLNDPIYLKSSEYNRVKEVEQQINTLDEQCNYVDEKEKKSLKKQIKKLVEEKILLQPQHLISHGVETYDRGFVIIVKDCYIGDEINRDYYIGDEINVFVDPDNPKNYLMEI